MEYNAARIKEWDEKDLWYGMIFRIYNSVKNLKHKKTVIQSMLFFV